MIWLFFGFVLALIFALTGISGAPWVPARSYDVEALLSSVKLKKGDVFYELGCGDGRLVKAAAERGAKAVGFELNPILWLIAKLRCWSVKGATVRLANLWKVDLSSADVVMVFLVPRTMPRLHQKALRELSPHAQLVSYVFPIVGKKPAAKHSSWYIYTYPKN